MKYILAIALFIFGIFGALWLVQTDTYRLATDETYAMEQARKKTLRALCERVDPRDNYACRR
jgi:hypothetical protein